MTAECVQRPDGTWVPVDDAFKDLWSGAKDFDARLAAQRSVLSDLTSRLDAQQAAFATLGARVAELEKLPARIAPLEAAIVDLQARVKALEPQSAYGVDVGKDQTTAQILAALAGKPDFCIVNATTGLFSVSPALAANTSTARGNADLVGFYHWSQTINSSATTPDKSDPVGEARHFVDVVKPQPGDLLVLDHEEALGTWAQRVAYAVAWLDEVKRLTGATPLIYLNWYWIQNMRTAATQAQWDRLVSYPLWLAEWSKVPGQHSTVTSKDGANPDSWPILIHQYAVVDNLDRDWTPDLKALQAHAV